MTKIGSVYVEVNGVFDPLIRVDDFPSWLMISNNSDVKECRSNHSAGKLESVGGVFPKVKRGDQNILEIR